MKVYPHLFKGHLWLCELLVLQLLLHSFFLSCCFHCFSAVGVRNEWHKSVRVYVCVCVCVCASVHLWELRDGFLSVLYSKPHPHSQDNLNTRFLCLMTPFTNKNFMFPIYKPKRSSHHLSLSLTHTHTHTHTHLCFSQRLKHTQLRWEM